MGRYISSLYKGTTSTRAVLFGSYGAIVAKSQTEFPQYFPNDGWV